MLIVHSNSIASRYVKTNEINIYSELIFIPA